MTVPVSWYLLLAAALFAIGVFGALETRSRRFHVLARLLPASESEQEATACSADLRDEIATARGRGSIEGGAEENQGALRLLGGCRDARFHVIDERIRAVVRDLAQACHDEKCLVAASRHLESERQSGARLDVARRDGGRDR